MRFDLMAVPGLLVVMWAAFLGCGLALERLAHVRLHNALLLPLGLCVALVLIFPGYVLGAPDTLAIILLVVVALVGFVFADGGLRARLNPGWPGAAGLAAYLLYLLPVIAYGHWTWSGYDFVNDTAFEMLLANHIKAFGTAVGHIPESGEREFLKVYLASGYPLGSQALLGTFSGLTDTPVEVLYQGYIAGLAATATVALATLSDRLLGARRAALAALIAISANLTYQYALQGGIKEIALLATLCAIAALARAAILMGQPYRGAVLLAVPAAGALAVYNAVAAPYLGVLLVLVGLGVVFVHRATPSPRWVWPLVAGGALAVILSLPSLSTFGTFFKVASSGQGSSSAGVVQFGQLLRPLPLSQISGVWLAGDYRLPVMAEPAATVTLLATVAILALLIPGLVWVIRRRETGPLLVLGAIAVVLAVVYPRVSPYARGKLLAIGSPAVVLVALLVLLGIRGRLARPAMLLAALLALAVWASDLIAYSFDRVAPTARMHAIEQVGDHFKGQGLVLWNEFEEYAKYLARAAWINVPFEPVTPRQVQLLHPETFFGHYFDLDEEDFSFVQAFPVIVTRNSPAASRPPADYRLVYENHYYLGWHRVARPQVLRHLPEQQLYSSSATVTCPALARLVAGAPSDSELVVAASPELAWFEPLYAKDRSLGWGLDPTQKGAVITAAPGRASGVVTIRGGARYAVWVQGDFPRPIHVQVDGRAVGSVSGSNTPGQWLQAGSLQLSPGRHRIGLLKVPGRDHLGPGEWGIGVIGAAALQREEPGRLRRVPLAHWRTLCGVQADWVELVRP